MFLHHFPILFCSTARGLIEFWPKLVSFGYPVLRERTVQPMTAEEIATFFRVFAGQVFVAGPSP